MFWRTAPVREFRNLRCVTTPSAQQKPERATRKMVLKSPQRSLMEFAKGS